MGMKFIYGKKIMLEDRAMREWCVAVDSIEAFDYFTSELSVEPECVRYDATQLLCLRNLRLDKYM